MFRNQQYYLGLARATVFAISAIALFLLILSLLTSQLGPVHLWYGGVRFRGWAENPNQLAMFMHPMPFLGWYLIQRTPSSLRAAPLPPGDRRMHGCRAWLPIAMV